jgi:hypothetical protein
MSKESAQEIQSYEEDLRFPEELRDELNTLNRLVGSETTLSVFKPLTPRRILLKAQDIWKEVKPDPFAFHFKFQDYVSEWIILHGIEWPHQKRLDVSENLAILMLNRLRYRAEA